MAAFDNVTTMITDVIPVFTALKDLIIAVAPILILIAIVMGLVAMFSDFFTGIFGGLTKMFKK